MNYLFSKLLPVNKIFTINERFSIRIVSQNNSDLKFLAVGLTLLWLCLLLFMSRQIQFHILWIFIDAYTKNIAILLLDKASCLIWIHFHDAIR